MTESQKFILGFGICAFVIALLVAPFRYQAHDSIAEIFAGKMNRVEWVDHAPIWSTPRSGSEMRIEGRDTTFTKIDSASLDSGKLLVWLAAIAFLVGAGFLMTKRRAEDPSRAF